MQVADTLTQYSQTGLAPAKAGELAPDTFMKFLDETRMQPAFRTSMDKAADYYDGNQLTQEVLVMLEAMGFSQLMTNLIKPAIDAVLGIEAKTRQDFRVTADDDQQQEVAEALSAKLAEAERESRADRACSEAYAGQAKVGLGWAHVCRNADPFLYKYRAESVHRREMYWDWSTPASDPFLDTSRFLIRNKWFPLDQIVAAMPEQEKLIRAAGSGWQPDWLDRAREDTGLMNAYGQETRTSVTAWEWRNIDNQRAALQECWYATHARGLVLDLGERVVEFDRTNKLHQALVVSGKFKPQPAVYRKLRCSIWFGPHKLLDYDPGTNKMPYVPFWGFREDLTGVPYGLIRSMMPLQDEVNARRRKLMWLLSSKRVQIDSDALDVRFNKFQDLVEEISRPDSMLVLNPNRANKDAVKVESDLGLSQQQFEILTEAKQGIQDAAGIFNSVMGKKDGGANSGIAINSLIEQSSNTLGELNDNFKSSRQRVGQLLLDMVRQDLSGRPVQVMAGPSDAKRKVISLNTPKVDELTGIEYRENDVDKAAVRCALEDVPSTPAYRAQQLQMIAETTRALPPIAQAALAPFMLEATDLPKRHQMADAVRKAMGMPTDGEVDPQVQQLQQQLQQLHAQSEQAMQAYEQAVQEQSQKAQELGQQVTTLTMQIRDKSQELALRSKELDLKAAESSRNAEMKGRELDLKKGEQQHAATALTIDAASKSADHEHRQRELAANQSQQQAAIEQQQLDAAGGAKTPEDEQAEQEQLVETVEKIVSPLADKLDMLIDAVQAEHAKAPEPAQPPPAPVAAPVAAPAPAPVSAPQPTPAPPPAGKPKKRTRNIKVNRGEDGRIAGLTIDDEVPDEASA